MMNVRKITVLSLLSIYLLSIVGTVCVVLNCDCVHTHRHGEHSHYCTGRCCHAGPCAHTSRYDEDSLPEISCECCGHGHSTSVDLYTVDDGRDHSDRVWPHAAYAVSAESVRLLLPAAVSSSVFFRPVPCVRSAASPGRALRAPPVCV